MRRFGRELEIFSGIIPGEAIRPRSWVPLAGSPSPRGQIRLSEPGGRVSNLQCRETRNGRKKILKREKYLAASFRPPKRRSSIRGPSEF